MMDRMPKVELMRQSARMDVLPRRCVITGSTQGVTFRRVWVPARAGWAVRMDLPFADMAYRRWNVSWLLLYIAIGLALAGFLAGLIIAAFGNVVGAVVYLSAALLPIGAWRLLIHGNGPEVLRQRRDAVVLHIPDDEAAREMQPSIDLFEYRVAFVRAASARQPRAVPRGTPPAAQSPTPEEKTDTAAPTSPPKSTEPSAPGSATTTAP